MPRHPGFSPSVQDISGAVYSALAHRLATYQGEVFPLHVGDTWMEPAEGCRMEDLHVAEYPGMHRYAPPQGMTTLLDAIVERVRERLTSRTVALYLNTPSNPAGQVIPRAWIEALVAWAAREDLWIIADEVYEDYVFSGEHTYTRPLAPERTFAAHSFSKAYGMAGTRCGYVVGPVEAVRELRKIGMHSFYSTPTAAQIAALRVMGEVGDAWIARAREQYRATGAQAAARLGLPAPEGSTFLFFDVAPVLDESGLGGFLERCVDRGLFLAPGPSFGPYPTHVRLCFTAAPPDVIARGVEALAPLLGR
jgi:aspartate/methionine/tyrosine aminotransferase